MLLFGGRTVEDRGRDRISDDVLASYRTRMLAADPQICGCRRTCSFAGEHNGSCMHRESAPVIRPSDASADDAG